MTIIEMLAANLLMIIGDLKERVEGVKERVEQRIDEVKEHIDERRNERLAERLDAKAKGRNWRESVVDLLDTVGMDSSFQARTRLARELGFVGYYAGTDKENIWLHGEVLKRLAAPPHFICLPARTK